MNDPKFPSPLLLEQLKCTGVRTLKRHLPRTFMNNDPYINKKESNIEENISRNNLHDCIMLYFACSRLLKLAKASALCAGALKKILDLPLYYFSEKQLQLI